jgi:hypothetical protein
MEEIVCPSKTIIEYYQKLLQDRDIFRKEQEENRKRIAEEMEKFEERKKEENSKKESSILNCSCSSSQKDLIQKSYYKRITSRKIWKRYETTQIP